jgi:hypothetical protein
MPNDLPFSSERRDRVRAYRGREEPRAQLAASRHETTSTRKRVAFGCRNGRFGSYRVATPPKNAIAEIPKTSHARISTRRYRRARGASPESVDDASRRRRFRSGA